MTTGNIQAIFSALNQSGVPYLILGGLAVVAHGFVRFTAGVDLILSLEPENLTRAVACLKTLGYRPRAPVAFDEFIDPQARQQWARDKGMIVFSLFSDAQPGTEVNLFIDAPLNFSDAYARAVRLEVAPGVVATFCGLDDLIGLKSISGRPLDATDIDKLRRLRKQT
jgi:hypothetical protein